MNSAGGALPAGGLRPLEAGGRSDLAAAAFVAILFHGMLFIGLPAVFSSEGARAGQRPGLVSLEISLDGTAAIEESDFVPAPPPLPEPSELPEDLSEPALPAALAAGAPIPEVPPVPTNASRAARPGSAQGGARAAEVSDWYLVYPKKADSDRRTGVVVVRVEILASGRAGKVELAESSGQADLDAAAVASLRRARFRPATQGGKAVTSIKVQRIVFRLPDDEAK